MQFHRTIIAMLLALCGAATVSAAPLRICATTPDVGSLARAVGGDQASVTVFAKGTESAHFVEPRPSFIKQLSRADLYIQTGLELEIGWAPKLLQNSRNGKVQPGAPGYLDASTAITPMEVPTTTVDRSMGDVHPLGNPHYLVDPINGLKVAKLIDERLDALRPQAKASFDANFAHFQKDVFTHLLGAGLVDKYGPANCYKLAALAKAGKLVSFLKSQNQSGLLGGWVKAMLPAYGVKVVTGHKEWVYFSARFGLDIVGSMEPKPGVTPTTKHLQELVQQMKTQHVPIVINTVYFDPRYARFVAQETGAKIMDGAHLPGAEPGTDDYIPWIDYNVKQVVAALGGK